jgi:DMSO/TMAO reductase YedYZ molybdopterin-dependent catalytic subunit
MYVAGMPQPWDAARTPEGRIVRTAEPPNEELDLTRLDHAITPNEQFYVRCHGDVPAADPGSWRLRVGGLVDRPFSLGLHELRGLRQSWMVATLECAGNRRTLQRPVPDGVPWGEGAVSTARWSGVALADLIERAAPRAGAAHVHLIGGDRCATDAGCVPFARSVPLDMLRRSGALVALDMNRVPLPPLHGAPFRAVVPAHYAMDSVKWLREIVLAAEPQEGPFQRDDYQLWFDDAPGVEIGPMRVASLVAHPRPGSPVASGPVRVHGAAWTGTGTIAAVEVSTDGGATWRRARLLGDALAGVWRLWEVHWTATPGHHVLVTRASDTAGNRQPDSMPPNRKGYANNFVVRVPVRVHP